MTQSRGRRRKALGQHWLVDRRVLGRIARAADITPEDTVIEVGAGTGLLTALLAQRSARLIAVEVDPELAAALRERFRDREHVHVLEANVLSVAPEELLARGGGGLPYVVVGNLPYFIGSAIVRHFLAARAQPRRLLVTLQAEVARNVAAAPGDMTFLSAEVQYYAEPRLLFEVPPSAFRPPPKVRSAVLRLDTRHGTAVEVDDREAFFRLVQAGFAARRKQLRNALAIGLGCGPTEAEALLLEAGLDAGRRAQTLTLREWAALYRAYRGTAAGVSR
ncbi:MAG: 16S rRNA (adenine(1518)-N(6)/adenine(1519)-N(6))-dimethyltransferase RsmA [Dehalococcoidia bacterium]|nr:16S rRNA (adenine(1518)-N(6)/adenine(1519)-N(6))-dimethyltransferase RsmA [Dehalococcoidia bacterium]